MWIVSPDKNSTSFVLTRIKPKSVTESKSWNISKLFLDLHFPSNSNISPKTRTYIFKMLFQ